MSLLTRGSVGRESSRCTPLPGCNWVRHEIFVTQVCILHRIVCGPSFSIKLLTTEAHGSVLSIATHLPNGLIDEFYGLFLSKINVRSFSLHSPSLNGPLSIQPSVTFHDRHVLGAYFGYFFDFYNTIMK